jgi:adenylylsulfate reductase subunit A
MCPSQTLKLLEEERSAQAKAGPQATRALGPEQTAELAQQEDTFGLGVTSGEAIVSAFEPPQPPNRLKVEISPSEPYVQGGHTAGGFWVDTNRRSTVRGLWAAGDAAGGAPQKYVTGSMAEGEIAALDVSRALHMGECQADPSTDPTRPAARLAREAACDLRGRLSRDKGLFGAEDLEEALQATMDLYAGGIGAGYRYSLAELSEAESRLESLIELGDGLKAQGTKGLARLWETRDKLVVARSLVAHLKARKETRWPGFGEFSDFPAQNDTFLGYVNSVLAGDRVEIIHRPLVSSETYQHPQDSYPPRAWPANG